MADKFLLEIVTPQGVVLEEEVEEVAAPAQQKGEFGVLKGHTHFITTLAAGVVRYRAAGKDSHLAIAKGYAEVLPEKTIILVDMARRAEEIDPAWAAEQFKAKEQALFGKTEEDPDYKGLTEEFLLARAMLTAAEAVKRK